MEVNYQKSFNFYRKKYSLYSWIEFGHGYNRNQFEVLIFVRRRPSGIVCRGVVREDSYETAEKILLAYLIEEVKNGYYCNKYKNDK